MVVKKTKRSCNIHLGLQIRVNNSSNCPVPNSVGQLQVQGCHFCTVSFYTLFQDLKRHDLKTNKKGHIYCVLLET